MSFKGLKILSLMHRWSSKREMMGDDPPYLAVGTEVSAKYKGAFCEAKVRKIVRSVKCKIAYKLGLGTAIVTDDQIKGTLRAGSVVEVKHADKKEYVEATIIKIQDCSQYTVVFDDGDITTLRRTALCLKSGRHFAESETLDQLPLTHPEHFGNPVIGGRRGRRNRHDDSSDDEGSVKKNKQPKEEKEADIGKVVCVEISEKKKQKDNWFPGLVVAPTAQDTVKINVKEDYLVRSFKDGRYYTVPKKEATPFTREIGQKVDNNTLRTAVEKALLFLDRDELPPHWDRELLFGLNVVSETDSDGAFDSDTSDDEPREEKDHFVAQLYKFMDDRGTPINKGPTINGRDVDLYKLFKVVHKLGGCNRVTNHNQWKTVSHKLGFGQNPTSINLVRQAYKKFLHSFEDFYRKLGCTMVNHPRGQRGPRNRSNRSLIRDKDKALPTKEKQGEKEGEDNKEVPVIEHTKEKENCPKEETKPKEVAAESLKPQRESRKDSQRPKSEKIEKKEGESSVKVLPSASKTESAAVDKPKADDREERLKMREMVKHDSNTKDESKGDKDNNCPKISKESKTDDSQKVLKTTSRREVKDSKKEEKEKEDKVKSSSEREIRLKKSTTPNTLEAQNISEESKVKKSRSLFSKITGSKRIKPATENKIPRANKALGLNAVRQKRTFSERMKAMVKKFKFKTGVKQHLRHKSPPPSESKESEEKKKVTSEESIKVTVPQLTRSKSKEEVVIKARKPEPTCDKKSAVPSSSQSTHSERKHSFSKKRKEDDKTTSSDEVLDQLPNYKSVAIGDKLKVYYGPTHESKVTYEAKVLNTKIEEQETLYLVHYTGWNTRYDEWIKRSRIADNLSWSPGRAKRSRQPQNQQSGSGRVSKRPKSASRESGGGGPRSTTPSSVTSSSSRTKSPAVSNAPKSVRSRARTRRASGHTHTDFSESEMEDEYESDDPDAAQVSNDKDALSDQRFSSDEKESKDIARDMLMERMRSRAYRPAHRRRMESGGDVEDSEVKKNKGDSEDVDRTRSRSEKRKLDESTKPSSLDDVKKDNTTDVLRSDRLRNKRKVMEDKSESGDEKEIKLETKQEDKRKSDSKQTVESEKLESDVLEIDSKKKIKRRSDELSFEEESKDSQSNERRRSRRVTPRKEDLKSSIKEEEDQPRGREFDLNQIRSELRGITPSAKVSLEAITLSEKEEDSDEKAEIDDNLSIANESERKTDSAPEDIYEFKEPEPFEFEVRSKCGEEKGGKIQRRTFGRMSDEPASTSPVSVRKKLIKMKSESPSKIKDELNTSPSSRRTTTKSILKTEESNKDSESLSVQIKKELNLELGNISKPSSSNENNSNESISEQKKESSSKKSSKNTIDEIQPLGLFSDLPGEVEERVVDEDGNGGLVISELETESDSQGPLFSHQQRDHEDYFPSSITLSSSVENSQNKSPFSGFSDKLKEEDSQDSTGNEKSDIKVEDNDQDNEDIMNAIQRALSQSSDEGSNDEDLLSQLPDPSLKNDFMSIIKDNDSSSESSNESNESQNEESTEVEMTQLNQSEESVDNAVEVSSSKSKEEAKVESNDSEASIADEKEILEIDDENTQSVDESKEEVDKVEDSQDVGKIVEIEKDVNEVLGEEICDREIEENNDSEVENDEEEEEDEGEACEVKEEEIAEESQDSEMTEVNTIVKDVVEEQVELSEEVVLEMVEDKKEDEDRTSEDEEEETKAEEENKDANKEKPKESDVKEETCEVEEAESNLESLLCEETIPGSPAPSSSMPIENPPSTSPELPFASAPGTHPAAYKTSSPPPALPPPLPPPPLPPPPPPAQPVANEAAPVMENTPPTTPESSLSPISNSPRGERSGSSPVPENESSKSNRDSSEVDLDSFPAATKIGHYNSEDDTNCGVGNTSALKKRGLPEENETQGIKKRRRSHKRSDDNAKRIKLSHRSPRHSNVGSESDDDMSENSLDLLSLHSRSPRPSKYNFFVQLDPELDGSQRIAVLQQKLAELRKTYMSVKAELACIDRRRKKLRRREREASVKTSIKPEVPCS